MDRQVVPGNAPLALESRAKASSVRVHNRQGVRMAKVAFVGLGVMGFPMAGHLAAKGHDVTVFNRNEAKARAVAEGAWRPHGRDTEGGSAGRRTW